MLRKTSIFCLISVC